MSRAAFAAFRAALVPLLLAAGLARAQAQGVAVRGYAIDSLRGDILVGARITLVGVRSVTSDKGGLFEFPDVAPGTYVLEMQHARLDSMGLPGISLRTVVTDGSQEMLIAIPSFATLWRAACGERPAPKDSGFVYGVVRDTRDGRTLPDAAVELIWVDVSATAVKSKLEMKQRLVRNQTSTDLNGEFSVCGVPLEAGLRLAAATDSLISGIIDIPAGTLPVLRRDLIVGTGDRTDTLSLGDISGLVMGADGKPVVGARVVVDDVPRGLTDKEGRFFATGILPGTRQLEILAIGRQPHMAGVDVRSQQATELRITMELVTTLDVVRIVGSPFQRRLVEEFADNKRMGFGSFLDSSQVGRRGTIESVFSALPGVELTRQRFGAFQIALPGKSGGKCAATIWIDGHKTDSDELKSLRPSDIAVVQVFQREYNVPSRYWAPTSDCGAAVVWTKEALR